jgi:hypothetical protein
VNLSTLAIGAFARGLGGEVGCRGEAARHGLLRDWKRVI